MDYPLSGFLGYSAIVSGPDGDGNKGFVANEFIAIFILPYGKKQYGVAFLKQETFGSLWREYHGVSQLNPI